VAFVAHARDRETGLYLLMFDTVHPRLNLSGFVVKDNVNVSVDNVEAN
jgi:hypothetical protein